MKIRPLKPQDDLYLDAISRDGDDKDSLAEAFADLLLKRDKKRALPKLKDEDD